MGEWNIPTHGLWWWVRCMPSSIGGDHGDARVRCRNARREHRAASHGAAGRSAASVEPDESKQAPPPAASSTAQPAPEKTPAMAAEARLTAERKAWRKDRPEHFVAKPQTRPDSSANLFVWDIVIPGKPGSVWAPGLYPATMTFTADYPEKPPVIKFKPIKGQPLFHPNVYTDGGVCMSIINPEGSRHHYGSGGTWKPAISIKQVLLALQMFLDEATSRAAGREEAYNLFNNNKPEYDKRVKLQVAAVEHYS